MYYLSFFRRTAFVGVILLLVVLIFFQISFPTIFVEAQALDTGRSIFYAWLLWSPPIWAILMIIHIITSMISLRRHGIHENIFENFFGSLWADIITPFISIISFIRVITGIHKIEDDSAFHNFLDFLEVLFGFLWTIIMIVIIVYGLRNFIL